MVDATPKGAVNRPVSLGLEDLRLGNQSDQVPVGICRSTSVAAQVLTAPLPPESPWMGGVEPCPGTLDGWQFRVDSALFPSPSAAREIAS